MTRQETQTHYQQWSKHLLNTNLCQFHRSKVAIAKREDRSADRLNRYEFERRYNAMPHLRKAELIEGVVYVPAALRFRSHGQPHANLIVWLGNYKVATPGIELEIEPTVRLDLDNEPQPDAVLLIEEQAGGQARLSEDDYIEGAPELVAEIAASSAAIDLGDKKRGDKICSSRVAAAIKVAKERSLEAQPQAHSHLKVTVIITISRESLKGENANDIAGIAKAGVAIAN